MDGPAPYKRKLGENRQCPNCGQFNQPDALFCAQCDTNMTGVAPRTVLHDFTAEPGPHDQIRCSACGAHGEADALFCDYCGMEFSGFAYFGVGEGPAAPEQASNAGRKPMSDTSPEARRRFLASLDDSPAPSGGGLIERIGAAERLVVHAERDLESARAALADARAAAATDRTVPFFDEETQSMVEPQVADRHLGPEARGRHAGYLQALTTFEQCERALTTAKFGLSALLDNYEQVSRPDLGLPPGAIDELPLRGW